MADTPKDISTEDAIKKMFRDDVVGNVISGLITILFGRQTIIGILIGLLLAAVAAAVWTYNQMSERLDFHEVRILKLERMK